MFWYFSHGYFSLTHNTHWMPGPRLWWGAKTAACRERLAMCGMLPKANIASENRPGPKRKQVFQLSIFRCHVGVREGNWCVKSMRKNVCEVLSRHKLMRIDETSKFHLMFEYPPAKYKRYTTQGEYQNNRLKSAPRQGRGDMLVSLEGTVFFFQHFFL